MKNYLQTNKNKNKMKKTITIITALILSIGANAQTETWTPLTSGTTTFLLGVSAVNSSICYVCGYSGLIRKTTDGGVTWVAQTSTTTSNLSSIFFTDVNNGVAVGDNGALVRTTNGGSTWTSIPLTTAGLRCVYFYDLMTGYIVGGLASSGTIYKTTDGGASWTIQTNSATSVIYGIKFTSATDGYFVDYAGEIFITTNGGTTWTALTSGTTTILSSIDFMNSTNGIATGRNGLILKTTTSGASWTTITSGTTDGLSDVKFVNSTTGFIVGYNISTFVGSILKTTDGGNTWAISYPGTSSLIRASFASPNCGYVVGENGTILKYTSTVGIAEESQESGISIYPNPTNGLFTVVLPTDKAEINVTDILGQILKTQATQKTTNLQLDNNGVYIVYVTTKQGTIARKLIVNR